LPANFFAAGRDDLERVGMASLLGEAREIGILNKDEADELDRIRRTRNPIAHFRRSFATDSIDLRSLQANEHWYELLEQDARAVVRAAMNALRKDAV
jgi:hypothetical protein